MVSGIARQLFVVLWRTTVQTKVGPGMLSRVSAYDFFGSFALAPLGIVLFGNLFELIGYRWTMLIYAGMIISTTLAIMAARDIRELRLRDGDP